MRISGIHRRGTNEDVTTTEKAVRMAEDKIFSIRDGKIETVANKTLSLNHYTMSFLCLM
jgi:hypothetical protein